MIGWALRQIVVWGVAVALFFAVLGNFLPRQQKDSAVATTAPAASAANDAGPAPAAPAAVSNALVFRADKQGHVWINGFVNGAPVRFLLDTGASVVALTMRDATAAGISRGELVFNMRFATANGVARAAPVRLREVRLGQLAIDDVQGVVHENLAFSLLGQTFLNRLDSYEMRDGVLTINWN